LWDKTIHGTVNASYRARGVIVELEKEQDRVARGVKKDADIAELLRSKMVSAMRCGKPLIICCGDEKPDLLVKWKLDEKWGITWDEVLDWVPFREKENYMKLVKEGENYDTMVNKGKFEMGEEFNIIFMCRYVKEDDFYELVETIPNNKAFMKVAITNV